MDITYTVNRSRKRRKTISLRIRNEQEVVISAPYFTPADEINRFVEEKQNWIRQTLQRQKEDSLKSSAKEYDTGEHFFYLGQSYPLEVFFEPFENAGVFFWNHRFFLNADGNRDLRKHYFVLWYKRKAGEYINQRVDFFGKMLKLRHEGFRITSAESRWGSCSADNNLSFSFRLIMAPPAVIDYVVVHELTHIREKNHSPKFWKKVEEVVPGYQIHRRWLRDNHHQFVL